MDDTFSMSQFLKYFPTDDVCLEEIKKMRFPKGIFCKKCKTITIFYKLKKRPAYECKFCRYQLYPLKGTIFEKSPTPLKIWFYCLFIMTHSRARLSIKQLQKELEVTYKTAWRMYHHIKALMSQKNGDLLLGNIGHDEYENKIYHWVFFNKFELKVVERKKYHQ